MQLSELGFDGWFQEQARQYPDRHFARISRVDRERYLVRNEHAEVRAELSGQFLFNAATRQDWPCVGDWVAVQYYNEGQLAIVSARLSRKTFLRRKTAGKEVDYQMLAANLDSAFIMQACDNDFNLRRLERYLIMFSDGGVEPVILLSKSDLISSTDLQDLFSAIRQAHITARVVALSNVTAAGYAEFNGLLEKARTYCLLGSSGVGKTTLLNRLLGGEIFATQAVRAKDGRGHHTTTQRQMVSLPNGAWVIDTPGMRELGLFAVDESIMDNFSEVQVLADTCRFTDCTHTTEPGCAIRRALRDGTLTEERLRSYQKLLKESMHLELSYAEKRQHDRQRGRMIKAALQQIRKNKPF